MPDEFDVKVRQDAHDPTLMHITIKGRRCMPGYIELPDEPTVQFIVDEKDADRFRKTLAEWETLPRQKGTDE